MHGQTAPSSVGDGHAGARARSHGRRAGLSGRPPNGRGCGVIKHRHRVNAFPGGPPLCSASANRKWGHANGVIRFPAESGPKEAGSCNARFFVSCACTWFEQCQAGGPECTQIKRMCPSGRPRTHPDHEQKPKVAATIWVKNHGFRNKEALYCHFSAPFLHCNIFLLRENTLHFFRGALIFLRPFCARPHHPFPQLVREPFPPLVRDTRWVRGSTMQIPH